jgi:hypothetical protein
MFILNAADPGGRFVLRHISRFIVLAYSLPIWAYYAVQLRSIKLLFGWLLLLVANVAMFRLGEAIDSGRIRLGILVLYGTLFVGLILIGLYGLLKFF